MSKCTWKECVQEASKEQLAKDGSKWADLCEQHHNQLDEAVGSMDAKKLLKAYILAQGGAKAAADRMFKP